MNSSRRFKYFSPLSSFSYRFRSQLVYMKVSIVRLSQKIVNIRTNKEVEYVRVVRFQISLRLDFFCLLTLFSPSYLVLEYFDSFSSFFMVCNLSFFYSFSYIMLIRSLHSRRRLSLLLWTVHTHKFDFHMFHNPGQKMWQFSCVFLSADSTVKRDIIE